MQITISKMQGFIDECVFFSFFCVFYIKNSSRKIASFVFYAEIQVEKSPVDSADNLGVKHFAKIALSPTISEINTFLQFTQKCKMTVKNGGKLICAKSRQ